MRVLVATVAALLLIAAPAWGREGEVQLGTALNSTGFNAGDAAYLGAVRRYQAVTPESALKLDVVQPSRGRYVFGEGDRMVDWAREQGLPMHGTTLIWCADQFLPEWLLSGSWTRAELLAVMKDHVTTVMKRYAGRVPAWDVVNEAFAANGSRRDCLWQRVIGDGWIEEALRAARAADPGARLFYNETAADIPNSKFVGMEAMAKDFVARGVPLDGIGLQNHLLQGDGPLQFLAEDAMRRIGALGLAVHVSELDGITSVFPGTREEKLDRQAQAFQTVASACQNVPACFRVTLWGAADHWSWRGTGQMAVALDDAYREKPAWAGIHQAIRTPAPSLQRPPTAPGAPEASIAPNAGVFTVGWSPSLDPEGDRVSYVLEHRDSDDAGWSPVASGIRGTTFSFVGGRLERQGTYTYRVRASDGRAAGAWSPESAGVVVDRTDPAAPVAAFDRAAAWDGWYRDAVVVTFGGAGDPPLLDGSPGSGVDPASVVARSFATTGTHTASATVRDRAGNASRPGPATVKVDASPPVAELSCPAAVRAGSAAAASWTTSDEGAGLAGPAAGELPLDTSRAGTFTTSVEVRDRVGHAVAATCEYVVEPEPEPTPTATPSPTATATPAAPPAPTATPSPTTAPAVTATPSAVATAAPPATAPPTSSPPAAVLSPGPPLLPPRVAAVVRGGRIAKGAVRLTVACPAACSGRVALRGVLRSSRMRLLGSARFRAAGSRTTVRVRLSRRDRLSLSRVERMRAQARVTVAGASGVAIQRVMLRR